MFRTVTQHIILTGVLFAFLISSCKTGTDSTAPLALNIRIPIEPESLNPLFTKSSYATQITSLILLPIAEYDPVSLKLSPLLITEIPAAENVTEGKHAGGQRYQLHFRPEATWSDGKPVTAEDYLFTLKAIFNPYVSASTTRGFLSFITEVETDPNDPKHASAYIDSSYILALEIVTNFNLYPAHIYDPQNFMSKITLAELQDPNKKWSAGQDTLLKQFATSFESPHFGREVVSGAGPYEFNNWATGEFIRLKRKNNYWGDKITNAPLLLQAYPTEITYRIITDAATAEAALKSEEIDVMGDVSAATFVKMKNDPEWSSKFQFASPALLQMNYLLLNNRKPVLADKKIRQALAYTLDYDGIMNNLLQGLGERSVGPIHPSKPYYDKDLKPVKQDINKAIALIKEAGWKDTNGNGIPDKMIDGKLQELSIGIKITAQEEGKAIANILKENAKKAGIEINIEVLDNSQFNEDRRQGNFDVEPMRFRSQPAIDDPYQNWHTESDKPGGGNVSGFHNTAADSIINEIRTDTSEKERDHDFQSLQELLYDEQPVIFLYVPLERIVVSKKFEFISSSRKPGYFENLFKVRS
ncbi:MAG TPA: ABC transporter substrate-binding protein [Saprospiraceae bacterium]|nr:ABC transporter substrate-binding protein [Saprospiraceae bacterium]